jgi:hypothetical protein
LPWDPIEPIGYQAAARAVTRRIGRARSRRELEAALRAGLQIHSERGYRSFVRGHAKLIYRHLLTWRERKEVRAETRGWARTIEVLVEAAFGEDGARDAREVQKEVQEWADHSHSNHAPLRSCEWCYGDLIEVVLRRRKCP